MTTKPSMREFQPPTAPGGMSRRSIPVRRIFWHCTADPEGSGKGPDDIWKTHVVANGWSHIGYHYLITEDGTIWMCRPVEYVGAGVAGENSDSVHISYVGGMDKAYVNAKDTRTKAQKASMYALTDWLLSEYDLVDDDIFGHNEFAAKACPSFDVDKDIAEWRSAEPGDPEPGMPDMGAMGIYLAKLEARVAKLEEHNAAWKTGEV